MVIRRSKTDQGHTHKKNDIRASIGGLAKRQQSSGTQHGQHAEDTDDGETDIGGDIIEIGNPEKGSGVGKQMVGRILGDGIQKKKPDQSGAEQTGQQGDALAEGKADNRLPLNAVRLFKRKA